MEQLMKEERLFFTPLTGEFDVEAVSQKVESLGFAFRDPANTSMFVICSSEESRAECLANRQSNPTSGYPMVLLIRVTAEQVYVNQFVGCEFLEYSSEFITWLTSTYPCRVTNEFNRDVTEFLK